MPALAFDIPVSRLADEASPYLSARRLADTLGLTLSEMSALTGLARNTLAARTGGRKVDVALSPLARIVSMASEMAGGADRAALWFKHQPIPGWAGKTALDLVREGKSGKVLAYLEAVRSGVYA